MTDRGALSRRAVLAGGVAGLAGVALSACGGNRSREGAGTGSSATSDPSLGRVSTGPDGVQELTLQVQDDYVFLPDAFTVAPGQVRLTVRNVAKQLTHNFRFTEGAGPEAISAEIPILPPGQTGTVEFSVTQPGAYGFECSFHVALGQVGSMTVAGA